MFYSKLSYLIKLSINLKVTKQARMINLLVEQCSMDYEAIGALIKEKESTIKSVQEGKAYLGKRSTIELLKLVCVWLFE